MSVVRSPTAAWEAFQGGCISADEYEEKAATVLAAPGLMCRVGDSAYPWEVAQLYIAARLVFGQDAADALLYGGIPMVRGSLSSVEPATALTTYGFCGNDQSADHAFVHNIFPTLRRHRSRERI